MEQKIKIFTRVPPGDRWMQAGAGSGSIHPTLTHAIEHHYQETGCKQYYIDAGEGAVYIIQTVPDKEPEPKKFSIYGDY